MHIFFPKDEWEHLVPQPDKDKINAAKVSFDVFCRMARVSRIVLILKMPSLASQKVLYLNRGLCKIKLQKIEDAVWDCDQVHARKDLFIVS